MTREQRIAHLKGCLAGLKEETTTSAVALRVAFVTELYSLEMEIVA